MSQYEPLRRVVDPKDAPPPPPPRLDLYMPAMPPLGLIHALETWWWAYRRRRRFRQGMLPLLACDDAILKDIGYRRADIHWALRLPLKVDALRALQEREADAFHDHRPS